MAQELTRQQEFDARLRQIQRSVDKDKDHSKLNVNAGEWQDAVLLYKTDYEWLIREAQRSRL